MDTFADIVYPDSPFLPKVTPENIVAINRDIMFRKIPRIAAIAYEQARISLEMSDYQNQDINWLIKTFKTDVFGIDIFMFGYTMIPSLIIGSYVTHVAGIDVALQKICPPASDDFLRDLNAYKLTHLKNCFVLYLYYLNDPQSSYLQFLNYVKQFQFSNHRFYLAGIQASKLNFEEIIGQTAISAS